MAVDDLATLVGVHSHGSCNPNAKATLFGVPEGYRFVAGGQSDIKVDKSRVARDAKG